MTCEVIDFWLFLLACFGEIIPTKSVFPVDFGKLGLLMWDNLQLITNQQCQSTGGKSCQKFAAPTDPSHGWTAQNIIDSVATCTKISRWVLKGKNTVSHFTFVAVVVIGSEIAKSVTFSLLKIPDVFNFGICSLFCSFVCRRSTNDTASCDRS